MSKFIARVSVDSDPESPREWCNLGTMACSHRRYELGDELIPYRDCEDWVFRKAASYVAKAPEDFADVKAAWDVLEKHWIVLPLYLYDHSGITISTVPFSCRWDSGLVGHIYVEKSKALKEFSWVKWTPRRVEQVQAALRLEVETYDQYLTGDVYCVSIDEVNESGRVIEADVENCGGFYGRVYAEIEAKSMVGALTRDMQIKSKRMFGATQLALAL